MAYRRRKRLRERVEARKRGLSEYVDGDEETPFWFTGLRWLAVALQATALILVMIEIYALISTGFIDVNYTKIAVYVAVFFTGRIIQFGLALFIR